MYCGQTKCTCTFVGTLLISVLCGTLYADMEAFVGQDVVELADGTRIECLVVMESSRGVLIIRPDPEKGEGAHSQQFIPSGQVKSITRGIRQGETKAFQTDTELARKVIQGAGLKQDDKAKPTQPIAPTGPIAPATPPVTQKPGSQPAPPPAQVQAKGALPPKDLVDAYLHRFPALQEAAEQLLGGQHHLGETLEKALADPASRQEAERMLELFFQTARNEAPLDKPQRPQGVKPAPQPVKPAPQPAKPAPAAIK